MKNSKLVSTAAALLMIPGLVGCAGSGKGGAETPAATAAASSAAVTAAETTAAGSEKQVLSGKNSASEKSAAAVSEAADGGTWAIYMYMCGSDLESDSGFASDNMIDLMKAARTDDTIFLAETGGSTEWRNNFVDAGKIQRWLYTDGDMQLVDEQDQANMGASDTFADFLQYASTNYPADHTMVLMWDHGDGTRGGCCVDRNYDGDTLSLKEMHDAFAKVYKLSEEDSPIDILGFDCCLMATLDVADTFRDTADYLVASEETEPGSGWNYTQIGESLGINPQMRPYDLGALICDSYYQKQVEADTAAESTLSLTDLKKIGSLKDAFNKYVDGLIVDAYNNPESFKSYAISANASENYGGNSRAEGYKDLIDIRNFVEYTGEYEEGADAVLKALDDCVPHKVTGEFRPDGCGLSMYYDFDGWDEKNKQYRETGTIDSLKVLYDFGVSGSLDEEESRYMEKLGLDPKALPAVKTFENYDFNGSPVKIGEDGKAYTDFGTEVSDCVIDAMYNIYSIDGDNVFWLGTDDEVSGDYGTGIVSDNMGGNWGYFDGNLAFMELTYDCSAYNLYSVPILVDGEKKFLQVIFDFDTKDWELMGARNAGSAPGRAEFLEDGTKVTLLRYRQKDGKIVEEEGATFTYQDDGCFEYKTLDDGYYAMEFVIEDIYTNKAISDYITFDLKNGVKSYVQ